VTGSVARIAPAIAFSRQLRNFDVFDFVLNGLR
jgi:hypothetical protein